MKTRLLASTAFRLAVFYSFAFATMTFAVGMVIYWALRTELGYELDQRVLAERNAIVRQVGNTGLAGFASVVRSRADHGSADMRYAVLGFDGKTIAGNRVERAPPPGWSEAEIVDPDGGMDGARVIASPIGGGGMLVVGADPESIERLDERIVPLFAAAFGLMAAIGIAGGFVVSVILRRRVETITEAAEAIVRGDIDKRMPVSGSHDEFDRLSATLNVMLDRISELLGNLQQVSSDIAHDLRTPLTRLRQKLEGALYPDLPPDIVRNAILDAIDNTDDMLVLFTAILSISEVEAGGLTPGGTSLDLSGLVGDIAESYGPAAEDAGRTITCDVEPGIEIDGNRELIAQLVVNLLDNALRHTDQGASIAVTLQGLPRQARLTIADDGPGIPRADRSRVFERFTRLERSRSTPGHGLGLSLVEAIAAAHGATLALEDNRPGVKMVISFKRGPA